jgi:flagellar FliJ protein
MKRFHFPLRPVAVMRANRELRAREALALALAAVAQAELGAIIQASRRGNFRAAEGAAFSYAFRREWAAELEAQKQLGAARAALEKRREACIEANRDLQVITRLEEKAQLAHRQEVQRWEQAQLDELAGQRASRRRASPL